MESKGTKQSSGEDPILELVAQSAEARKAKRAEIAENYPRSQAHEIMIVPMGKTWVVVPGPLPGVHAGDIVSWGAVGTSITCKFAGRILFQVDQLEVPAGEWRSLQVNADVNPGQHFYQVLAGSVIKGDDGNDPSIIVD